MKPPRCTYPDCKCTFGCVMEDDYLGDAPWYHWVGFIGVSIMLFTGVAMIVRVVW